MIDFKHVSFQYPSHGATIHDVSFHINSGDFVAIIGENGAGKTTLSKMIMGLLKPTSGTVTVAGMDTGKTRVSKLAAHVGYLFQNPDMQICQKTVKEELSFSLRNVTDKTPEEIESITASIMEEYGFSPDDEPFNLSRGTRQRLALASLIALAPDVLILDEPTTGLDYRECMHMMESIRQLNKKGVTVVMVCHDMEIVLDFATRIIVLEQGKVLADGPTSVIFRDQTVMETAAVLPPQIIQLGSRLGAGFASADSVEEMTQAIIQAKENS
ncbi:MAG: ABC transporter ATP-binding protein [Lachnospiraceae bacterium]|nr:ABC transporter ATP-binding protein [Lachnospiraceae bacterium]